MRQSIARWKEAEPARRVSGGTANAFCTQRVNHGEPSHGEETLMDTTARSGGILHLVRLVLFFLLISPAAVIQAQTALKHDNGGDTADRWGQPARTGPEDRDGETGAKIRKVQERVSELRKRVEVGRNTAKNYAARREFQMILAELTAVQALMSGISKDLEGRRALFVQISSNEPGGPRIDSVLLRMLKLLEKSTAMTAAGGQLQKQMNSRLKALDESVRKGLIELDRQSEMTLFAVQQLQERLPKGNGVTHDTIRSGFRPLSIVLIAVCTMCATAFLALFWKLPRVEQAVADETVKFELKANERLDLFQESIKKLADNQESQTDRLLRTSEGMEEARQMFESALTALSAASGFAQAQDPATAWAKEIAILKNKLENMENRLMIIDDSVRRDEKRWSNGELVTQLNAAVKEALAEHARLWFEGMHGTGERTATSLMPRLGSARSPRW